VPLERVIERVPADGRRPLASDRAQMEHLYARRQAAYSHAHLRVDAARPVAEIVERILEWVGF
jgi:shikimate kinase